MFTDLAHLSIAFKNQNKWENMELLDRSSDGQNGNQNMESAQVSVNDQQNAVNLIQGSQGKPLHEYPCSDTFSQKTQGTRDVSGVKYFI